MYERFGCTTYQTVLDYNAGDSPENAFNMRKVLLQDRERECGAIKKLLYTPKGFGMVVPQLLSIFSV